MTWATWQTELVSLFADLSEIPFDWAAQPRGMHVGSRGQVDLIGLAEIGTPDLRHLEDGADPNVRIEKRIGQRRLTLQLDVWSPRQALEHSARAVIERIRSRLYFASTSARLLALHLGLIRLTDPLRLDPIEDARTVSRWSMDALFSLAWEETDGEHPGTWIDSVEVSSASLRDPGGDPLPAPLQTTQVIP